MLQKVSKFFSPRHSTLAIVGLLLTLGIVGEQNKPVFSNQIEKSVTPASTQRQPNGSKIPLLSQLRQVREQRSEIAALDSESASNLQYPAISSANLSNNINNQKSVKEAAVMPRVNLPTKDGIYLYGQSPNPNQAGQGYVLFQKQKGRVSGALYMPDSEFSCFQGTLETSGELAMTVTGSPAETSLTQVATSNRLPTLYNDEFITYAYSVTLQNYHPINAISANDRRILQECNQPAQETYTKLVK